MTETALVKRILLRIVSRPDCRVWRSNTGMAYAPLTQRGRDALKALTARGDIRPIHYGVPGQGDISGILKGGRRLELEAKSETGRLEKDQVDFGKMVNGLGGVWREVRSEEDAEDAVEEAMCPKK